MDKLNSLEEYKAAYERRLADIAALGKYFQLFGTETTFSNDTQETKFKSEYIKRLRWILKDAFSGDVGLDELVALQRELDDREGQIAKLGLLLKQRDDAAAKKKKKQALLEIFRVDHEKLLSTLAARHRPIKRLLLKRRIKQLIQKINESGLFNETWYRETYPDAKDYKGSLAEHYVLYGAYEMRNPNPQFDCTAYHDRYPDVTHSKTPAFIHYVTYGIEEGRELEPE